MKIDFSAFVFLTSCCQSTIKTQQMLSDNMPKKRPISLSKKSKKKRSSSTSMQMKKKMSQLQRLLSLEQCFMRQEDVR